MADRDPNELQPRREFLKTTATGTGLVGASLTGGGLVTASLLSGQASAGTPNTHASTGANAVKETNSAALKDQLQKCLGGPFPDKCPLKPKRLEKTQKDGYRIEKLTYEVEPGDRVPAYLLVPESATKAKPAPAVAVWHQHAGQFHLGKSEPAGLAGNAMHHTGLALCKLGYVVLCPDALAFEERQDPTRKLRGMSFERFEFLRYVVNGQCMAWKNIHDMRRAIDFLVEQPEVNAQQIGCYGHSMGSTHTWLVGPFEERIKALVGNCCMPTYAAIHDKHMLHCFPNFVPGWLQYGDTGEIAGLIAPRALHLNLGGKDGGSPIEHARVAVERIARMYAEKSVAGRFTHFVEPDAGHVLSPAMWKKTRAFFEKYLRSQTP